MRHTPDPAAFIRANLPVRAVPGVAEIVMHTAAPESRLGRLVENSMSGRPPYWAYPWAGGIALTRYIFERPETVRGLTVLDLGSGSGLVGIAAALAGAAQVLAAEIDPNGRAALQLNASLNGVELTLMDGDPLTGPLPEGVDVVLAGDVFYDPAPARRATQFLDRCLVAGVLVLVGDPGRKHLPLDRLDKLAEYRVVDFGSDGISAVFSWRLRGWR